MIQITNKSEYFLVSNDFVDNFLCEANGSFVKVYLYLLRNLDNKNLEMSDIANALNLLESDVIRAFKYWQKQGVLSFSKFGENDYEIDFTQIETKKDDKIPRESSVSQKNVNSKSTTSPTAINYTKSELTTYMKNNDGIRHMFLITEQLFNRSLTDTERKVLFGFYDYLGLPVEVIFTLLEHCVTNGKTNMRYIEKVACSWADREINTLAKASKFVKEENEVTQVLKKFKKMFKITGREFTTTEEDFIKDWVYRLKLPDDVIMQAFDKTVTNTGKIAFKYMDTILKNSSDKQSDNSNKVPLKKNFFQDYNDDEMSDFERQIIKNRVNKN